MEYLVAVILVIVVAGLVGRRLLRRVVLLEYERGVLYQRGAFRRVLGPGIHWYLASESTVHRLDLRPHYVTVGGQEVMSADHVSLKISLAARYEIADAQGAVQNSDNYQEALYLELQLALRQLVGAVKIEEVLEHRAKFGADLLAAAGGRVAALGLRLLAVDVKDIMFPGELKRVFSEVVRARQEGLAALERARGETAALRNLANAARLLEGNPALMQLRLVQTVGAGSGNTLVLGVPDGSLTGLPKRGQPASAAPPVVPAPPEAAE